MALISTNKALELKTSRSGRLLIPRLRNWTGERVVMMKTGLVQVLDGSPDCTSTFLSERKLFQASAKSLGLSQSLNISRVRNRSSSKLVKLKGSESLPISLNQQRSSKRNKTYSSLREDKPRGELDPRGRSPRKRSDLQSSNSKSPDIKVHQGRLPLDKPEPLRKSRLITRYVSSYQSSLCVRGHSASSVKVSQVPQRHSPLEGCNIQSSQLHKRQAHPTHSFLRKKSNIPPKNSGIEPKNTIATSLSPRKKLGSPPSKTLTASLSDNRSFQKNVSKGMGGKALRSKSERDQPDQAEMEENAESDVDIFGSEFQPVVRLVRLLPEEILATTCPPKYGTIKSPPESTLVSDRKISSQKRKSPSNYYVGTPPKTKPEKKTWKMRLSPLRASRQTVRDTQKILEILENRSIPNEIEDEAISTSAFFKNSCTDVLKNLHEVDDILNNDFGESDDNLSFRSIYERESSPMPSVPVSPISSFVETDAENSIKFQ